MKILNNYNYESYNTTSNFNSFKANIPNKMPSGFKARHFIPENVIKNKFAQKKRNPRSKYNIEWLDRSPYCIIQQVKSNGKLIKAFIIDLLHKGDDNLTTTEIYSPINGKVEKWFQANENGFDSLTFNPITGNCIKYEEYDKNACLRSCNLIDENTDNIYSSIKFYPNGETIQRKLYCDKISGNRISRTEYNPDGNIKISERYYKDGITIFSRTQPCPDNENNLKIEYFAEDGERITSSAIFDKNTNKLLYSCEYNQKNILTKKYEYDLDTDMIKACEEYYTDGVTLKCKSVIDTKTQIVTLIEQYSPDGKSYIKRHFDNTTGCLTGVEESINGTVRVFKYQ